MERIIISHNEDEFEDTLAHSGTDPILWNKDTIKTQDFKMFAQRKLHQQRNKELKDQVVVKNFDDERNYLFITLQTLCNARNNKYTDRYVQTIGVVKVVDDGYRLYPLNENNEYYIKLKFNDLKVPLSNTYARVYGFNRCFNFDQEKITSKHILSAEILEEYLLEINVSFILDLGALKHAQDVEEKLHKINYCKC